MRVCLTKKRQPNQTITTKLLKDSLQRQSREDSGSWWNERVNETVVTSCILFHWTSGACLVLCYPLAYTCLYFPSPVSPFFFVCLFSSLPFFPFSFSLCTGPSYIAQVGIELLLLLQPPKGWWCRQAPLHSFLLFGSYNFELLKERI